MSRSVSPSGGKPYGLARVCRVRRAARATVYRHRVPPRQAPPRRPGPIGAMPDAALVEAIRAVLAAGPFHGEATARSYVDGLGTPMPTLLLSRHRHCSMLSQRAPGQAPSQANRRFAPGV